MAVFIRLRHLSLRCAPAAAAVMLLLMGLRLAGNAQDKGTIRGFVADSSNGETLPSVNLIIQGTTHGGSTNANGYFTIVAVPAGEQILTVSCIGFITKRIPVRVIAGEVTSLRILLRPTPVKLGEVVIIGNKEVRRNEADIGLQKISGLGLKMTTVGVEADLFKVLQMNAGVNTTGDVTTRYYVRGGNTDQNLVLINGATVYNPFHALGIVGSIDPELISSLEFYKGGFAPRFGGRLSSILNVVTKDGNRNSYHASAQGSLLSGKFSLEGPIPGGSMFITGRKSYYGEILRRNLNGQEIPFDFYDLSFKLNTSAPILGNNSKFVVHGFLTGDRVRNHDPFVADYFVRNNILGMNWHKVWADPLYSVLSVSYSGFYGELSPNLSASKPKKNEVVDFSVDWDFSYMYPSKDEFGWGVQTKILHTSLFMENLYGYKSALDQAGGDLIGYIDYHYYRWEDFGLTMGMRFHFLTLAKYSPVLFEPRVSATYRLNPIVTLKAAFGWNSQEVATLTDETELVSIFEPWVIVPNQVYTGQAVHWMAGVETYISENCNLDIETYYKPMFQLLDINDRKRSWTDHDFMNDGGRSYGLEVSLRYQPGSLYLQTSYSLSWTRREKHGVEYIPRTDTRHVFNVLAYYDLGAGWEVNTGWSLKSGLPFTPIAGYYDRPGIDPWNGSILTNPSEPTVLWGARNSASLPVYHRLDLNVMKKFALDPFTATVGASVVNIYDRSNIFYLDGKSGKRIYMMPFSPSVFVKVEL